MQFFVGQKAKAPEVKNKAKRKIVSALQRESSVRENAKNGFGMSKNTKSAFFLNASNQCCIKRWAPSSSNPNASSYKFSALFMNLHFI